MSSLSPHSPQFQQGGWAQHDFSLAYLQAAWYFSEGGHGMTRNSRFKKGCVKWELLCYPSSEFKSAFNVYWHGRSCRVILCRTVHLEVSFFEGGLSAGGGGGIVYDIVWKGCPRRTPWIMLRTPVCFRILSLSLTSVSMFCLSYDQCRGNWSP